MNLICESNSLEDYVAELEVINFSHLLIQQKVAQLFSEDQTDIEKVRVAFEFVRDEVSHSWDIQSNRITCKASNVLEHRKGICYAKSIC